MLNKCIENFQSLILERFPLVIELCPNLIALLFASYWNFKENKHCFSSRVAVLDPVESRRIKQNPILSGLLYPALFQKHCLRLVMGCAVRSTEVAEQRALQYQNFPARRAKRRWNNTIRRFGSSGTALKWTWELFLQHLYIIYWI